MLLILAGAGSALAAEPGSLTGGITVSLGRNLDSVEPLTAFSFEPQLGYQLDPTRTFDLYMQIDRPTDPHENFNLPKTILTYTELFSDWNGFIPSLRLTATALELERWGNDGVMFRPAASLQLERELSESVKVSLRAGGYGQLNQYRQRTSGADLPQFGFSERVGLLFTSGDFSLDVRILFEQQYTGVWKNNFATVEQIKLQLEENFAAGLAHELLGSLIDDSTGSYSGFKVFDSRQSRVSLFADFTF